MSASSTTASAEADPQLERLRAENQVQPMSREKDGFSAADQDNGAFGHTSSPFAQEAPMFQRKIHQSFECHKLPDGSLHLIGFVTPAESGAIKTGREAIDLKLYPDPHAESTHAVSLPLERLAQVKAPSRDEGNFMRLRVTAIQ